MKILVAVPKLNMSPQFGPHTEQNINTFEMTQRMAARWVKIILTRTRSSIAVIVMLE